MTETPHFESLDEAWIDLCNSLDPRYLKALGQEMRGFFYGGAWAALTLILKGRLTELERDLDRHIGRRIDDHLA